MSLAIPDSYSNRYNILSIDPGSNYLGIAIITINPTNNTIINIYAFSIAVEHLLITEYHQDDIDNNRHNKMSKIKNEILRILDFYKPLAVICETPFFNRLRPGAFAPLVEVLYVLKDSVLLYNSLVPFITAEPSIIKKAIGAGHICGKDEVKETLYKNKEIQDVLANDFNLLDEHAIDAIAVGYTYFKSNR
jgi:Holliday junction resolvasome RuvABC endonuclease subunit